MRILLAGADERKTPQVFDCRFDPPGRRSAFHTAIRAGEDEIVEYLADHGADFDALDQFGRTPLEEAEVEAPTHTIELMRRLAAERAAGIR